MLPNLLADKNIIVGITGGIAAYKCPDLVRRLREQGAHVRVVMTTAAQKFITPLTLQAVSGNPVHHDLFDLEAEAAMGHIELARWADLIIVAPASADFMAKLTYGFADNLLLTLCLATTAPIVLAPAMNKQMWSNAATQSNVKTLLARHIQLWGPDEGSQACGEVGVGRMLEPQMLAENVCKLFCSHVLKNKKILLTAGPTQESIDPMRFISNHSSGKMGYALAQAAQQAGAEVTLVSGPVNLPALNGIEIIKVTSGQEMHDAVMKSLPDTDIFIGAAAVADYRVDEPHHQKQEKIPGEIHLRLSLNPDIISTVASKSNRPFVVGFAAQTHDLLFYAKKKLVAKKLDMIVANVIGNSEVGFGSDQNAVTVLWDDQSRQFDTALKTQLAHELIHLIAERYYEKNPTENC